MLTQRKQTQLNTKQTLNQYTIKTTFYNRYIEIKIDYDNNSYINLNISNTTNKSHKTYLNTL